MEMVRNGDEGPHGAMVLRNFSSRANWQSAGIRKLAPAGPHKTRQLRANAHQRTLRTSHFVKISFVFNTLDR